MFKHEARHHTGVNAFECATNVEKKTNRRASGNLVRLFRRIKCVSPDQRKELRDKGIRDPEEEQKINIVWISRESR